MHIFLSKQDLTFHANCLLTYFSKKIRFDISCKLSPQETICIKCQMLFSGKNYKNISKCHLLKFLPSMPSVKMRENLSPSKGIYFFCRISNINFLLICKIIKIYFLFFTEKKFCYYIQTVSFGDNLNKMSKNNFNNLPPCDLICSVFV